MMKKMCKLTSIMMFIIILAMTMVYTVSASSMEESTTVAKQNSEVEVSLSDLESGIGIALVENADGSQVIVNLDELDRYLSANTTAITHEVVSLYGERTGSTTARLRVEISATNVSHISGRLYCRLNDPQNPVTYYDNPFSANVLFPNATSPYRYYSTSFYLPQPATVVIGFENLSYSQTDGISHSGYHASGVRTF